MRWGPLLLAIISPFVLMFLLLYFTDGFTQIERVQKFRNDFVERCHLQKGKVVSFGKGSVSKACVGPDGRWLEYY
jgi:hypothetical protein